MEITQTQLDELKGLVEQVRQQHEKSREGLITDADFKGFQAKMEGDLNGLLDRVAAAETKAARPAMEVVRITDAKGRVVATIDPDNPGPGSEHKAFMQYVRKGIDGVAEVKALSTDDDSQGGYATSPTIRSQIIRELVALSPFRNYAARETITGNELQIPTEAGTSFESGWVGERSARNETKANSLGMLKIPLHEMYAKPMATQTMLDDTSFNVEQWITSRTSESFALREGDAFINGDGVGKPEGILTVDGVTGNNAYVKSGKPTGSNDPWISSDAMRKLEYALKAPYARNATFMMKRSTVLELMLLKDTTGRYLWQPALTAGQPSTFDGYPIAENEDMPAVAANAFPVLFGDFARAYQIVDKATVGMLRDPFSSKPFVEFYTTARVGGKVVMAEAVKAMVIKA